MKADAHRKHAEDLERATELMKQDLDTAESEEVQKALKLLEEIRIWVTT